MRKQRLVRIAMIGLAAIFLGSSGLLMCSWSPGAKSIASSGIRGITLPHRLRNSKEHDEALSRTGNPYLLEISAEPGHLLYYGARHASDPDDPQVADIMRRWAAFHPTVALCEGRSRGYFVGAVFEKMGGLSEPALVHKLARRHGVPVYSLEPVYEDEVQALLEDWSAEQVAMYFTLRVYFSEAGGSSHESLALDLLRKRTSVRGLAGSLSSLADLDRVWRKEIGAPSDWRTQRTMPRDSVLDLIGRDSNRVRGEHMARILIDLTRRGERVFAVVGSGHVIRQEWNLRAVLGAPTAFDQPVPEDRNGQP